MSPSPADTYSTTDLVVQPLSAHAFAPFGTVLAAIEDGLPYDDHAYDARLELSAGVPRFYTMRLVNRGLVIRGITRHRRVTQALASAGGQPWLLAVAPPLDVDRPDAEPALESIRAFRIPGDVAVMLARGTWHAGPLFTTPHASFFNLELWDTNLTDHQTCLLTASYHTALRLVDEVSDAPVPTVAMLPSLSSPHRGS